MWWMTRRDGLLSLDFRCWCASSAGPESGRVKEMAGSRLALAQHQIGSAEVCEDSEPVPIRELAALRPLHTVQQHDGDLRLAVRDPRSGFVDQGVDLARRGDRRNRLRERGNVV